MAATPKKNSKDDELFPDTGEKKKTQTRKVEKAEKAEKKTTKVEKALPKEKPPTKVEKALEPAPVVEKPAKLKSGPVKAIEPEVAPKGGMPTGVKALIGAMVLTAVVGAAALIGPALIATNDSAKAPRRSPPRSPSRRRASSRPGPTSSPWCIPPRP